MQTETVTRLRATTTTDPYSSAPVEDWTTPTELDLETLAPAEPRPSAEPSDATPGNTTAAAQLARNAVTSGFTLYLPEDVDVTAKDRMRVRGGVYKVLGDPALWLGAGVVVQVGRMEG